MQETVERPSPEVLDDTLASESSTIPATSAQDTPATSRAPSESYKKQDDTSTPIVDTENSSSPVQNSARSQEYARRDTRSAIAVPIINPVNKSNSEHLQNEEQVKQSQVDIPETEDGSTSAPVAGGAAQVEDRTSSQPSAPKSWADLVRSQKAGVPSMTQANGISSAPVVQALPKSASLAEALRHYTSASSHLHFIEPRGLVNTGNMCYMNSVSFEAIP